jgi:hypothetical protein
MRVWCCGVVVVCVGRKEGELRGCVRGCDLTFRHTNATHPSSCRFGVVVPEDDAGIAVVWAGVIG